MCILNNYDIIYEILKYIDIHDIYMYKHITKRINNICNNILYKKNKKYIYYIKNFIDPSLFNMALSFNNTYTYYYGLFIRLETIFLFIKENNLDIQLTKGNEVNEVKEVNEPNVSSINIRFSLLKFSLENDISFKLMDISFHDIYNTTYELQLLLKKLKK